MTPFILPPLKNIFRINHNTILLFLQKAIHRMYQESDLRIVHFLLPPCSFPTKKPASVDIIPPCQSLHLFPLLDTHFSLCLVYQVAIFHHFKHNIHYAQPKPLPQFTRFSRKKGRRTSSMVKTQCRCWVWTSLEAIFRVRAMAYFVPQEGQKRLWQRKGTNLRLPQ